MTTVHPPPGWYPDPSGAPSQRYFDGTDWTMYHAPPTAAPVIQAPAFRAEKFPLASDDDDESVLFSDAERAERLDTAVAYAVAHGWRVESRSTTQAVLVSGHDASGGVHFIHAMMTLFTFGLWVFVWILYAMSRHEDRVTVTIDPYGEIINR